jgi:hypothetical protein
MWFLVVVVGFGLMCVSYYRYVRVPEPAPWFNAFMCVGREAPAAAVEGVEYTEAALRWHRAGIQREGSPPARAAR